MLKVLKCTTPIMLLSCLVTTAYSAEIAVPEMPDSLKLIGYLKMVAKGSDGSINLHNQVSRIGLHYDRPINKYVTMKTEIEVGMNFLSDNSYENSGDGNLPLDASDDALTSRLGNIAFDFKEYGELRVGKQWSVYADVAAPTDLFDVSGGLASGVYSLQSDGGFLGTGRSDKAASYKVKVDKFTFGAQVLLRGNEQIEDLGHLDHGYTGAILYSPMKDLTLGVAYNEVLFKLDAMDDIRSNSTVASINYVINKLTMAYTFAYMEDAESSSSTLSRANLFSYARGHELYINYNFGKYEVFTGANYLDQSQADNNTELKLAIAGFRYKLPKGNLVGIEAQLDESKNKSNENVDDNFVAAFAQFTF